MRSYLPLSFGLVSACLLLLPFAPSAKAQCGVNTRGYGDLGIVSGNPFHAEMVVTRSGPPSMNSINPAPHPRLVARDTQGRVRTERVTGEFTRDTGTEAGSEAEKHMIAICDTGAQTLTQIDTLNATATILHSRPSAPSHSTTIGGKTFCSTRLPSSRNSNMTVEDLGYQTIEGVLAHGERITMKSPLGATASGNSLAGENTTELWCSDELSAVVLRVSGNARSGLKTSIAMRNIERAELDPALFQIPSDYAVTESVAQPHGFQKPNVEPNPHP